MAVDGSDHAERAFDKSVNLAHHFDSSLDVVHVIDDSAYGADSAEAYEAIEGLKVKGMKLLDKYKSKAQGSNLKQVRTFLEVGNPAKSIIERASQNNSDLIIVGSRGLGLFKELLIGSVSSKVSQHAKCQVMMVR